MIKRIFDIVASFIGLLFLWPLLLIITFLIKLRMPGPALFVQKRVGRYGKLFKIYKFRTMIVCHGGNTISVKGEDRITPLGAVLRKFKLDELPELYNVLIGDMSFVGPRPDMPEYYERLSGEERKILELRPGITGPASLKYANEEEILASVDEPKTYNDEVIWPDKVSINLTYYYNNSLFTDINIILKTIFGFK
ncbi:sugar transferase [Plebeiibacterium marinum]|uniref:Sugar transferase n=1 Tax=Plebeiibacterium marinum TaxID=2992111 RepID=A0AAE3MB07_9BACT|nr:sugar transferase [Plebeiobacterium marinum]MCW3804132.1 sugar transferase [Plebeiobacterium marinum]